MLGLADVLFNDHDHVLLDQLPTIGLGVEG